MITTELDTTVRDRLADSVAAWDAQDADAFAALYSDEATVTLATGANLRGRDQIRDYMAAGFAAGGPLAGTRGYENPQSIRVLGDVAVVTSESGFTLPGESSVPAQRVRRSTWVLSRQDEQWQVEAYHNC
jgi:uncharacterized protein (TIGR02246 family)